MRVHFWQNAAILLGGPLAVSFLSLSLARFLEEEAANAGPVIPPLDEPGTPKETKGKNWSNGQEKHSSGNSATVFVDSKIVAHDYDETAQLCMCFG